MSRTLTLPENTQGRDFVVGDIHGAYELLIEGLKKAAFDPAKDRVISVGDLADRGPHSPMALHMLQQPWFHAIRGNHEDLFLSICDEKGMLDHKRAEIQRQNGLGWVFDQTPETLAAIHAAFSKLPLAMDVKTDRGMVGFVHAEVPTGMDWQTFKQNLEAEDSYTTQHAMWSRDRIETSDDTGVAGIDRLFSGHSVQKGGPTQLGNCFYIDTGAFMRVLYHKTDMFLTLADIRAQTTSVAGPAEKGQQEKVVTTVPVKGKPFGAHRPR